MTAPTQPIEIEAEWHIPYLYSAGTVPSRFLMEMRDNSRIMGTRCESCRLTLVPARPFCPECYKPLDQWVAVGPEGTVESFTVCYESYTGLPQPPFVIALVKLQGADTSLVNYLTGVDASQPQALKVGMPVKAVFHDDRKALITDFHFEPKS